jgi:hypothetical protein
MAERSRRRLGIACRTMRATLCSTLLLSFCIAAARADEGADSDTETAAKPNEAAATTEAKPEKPAVAAEKPPQSQVRARLIGATTTVTEVASGLPFAARVDTGATTCSIHCEKVEIKNEEKDPKENIGKPIRFLVKNKEGKAEWVESKIVDHVKVRTTSEEDERYKVQLKLRWEDVEKKVHVTLNDRQHMKYPLLLGRNFLRDDFLVNVSLENSIPDDKR